jgi:transcription initiation factor TFIIIB Brf1 subunit/transcription initiation factor TFIIB
MKRKADDPTPVVKKQKPIERCKNCGSDDFVFQYKEGDKVCTACGVVADERMISEEAEYRLFSDDSSSLSKVRAGPATSIYLLSDHSTGQSRLAAEERQFLYDGWKNIDQVVNRLFPDSQPAVVRSRAKELFQKAFLHQLGQKQGHNEFKKGEDDKNVVRQRFSKRKTIVVAALYHAFRENNIELPETLDQLNRALEGDDVSMNSVSRCLEELGVAT